MISIGVTWGSHEVEKIIPQFDYVCYNVLELRSKLEDLLSHEL